MHLLFDLDGTLTDSAPGILRCINHAVVELGYPALPEERLRPMIGAHLRVIFGTVLETADGEVIGRAVEAYRIRFNDVGIFENSVFPGVVDALEALRAEGHTLQVVTAKPAVPARRVIEHFGLNRLFDAVHGPELTAHGVDKGDLVAAALRRGGALGTGAAMIGDRAEDIHAGRRNGIHAVAAAWGYGLRDELVAAGPDHLAEGIDEVVAWVGRQAGLTVRGA